MKPMVFVFTALSLLTIVFGPQVCAQETVWVSSAGASLKADRAASSDTIASLSAGTQLSVLSFENRWYRVKTPSGDTGWIYRGNVSTEPPEKTDSKSQGDTLGNLLGGITGSSIHADASDTSRSIRGLTPEAKAYAQSAGTPETYQKALDQVLSRQIRKDEVDAFLRSGKLGEYGP